MQARRILKLAKLSGLKMLCLNNSGVILGSLPLIAERPIDKESISNQVITLKKYYIPLDLACKQANDIYRRIVNFPCHDGLAKLTDNEILDVMHNIQAPVITKYDLPE